jgi:hypothetical protein
MHNPEPFLRFLAVQNPQLAQTFAANPELLVQLLAAVEDSEGEEGLRPSAQVINVQGEDRVAIERVSDCMFLDRSRRDRTHFSWKLLDSLSPLRLKPIWSATRTRSLLRIIFLRMVFEA